ncbi:MFS general substrate transporter [Aspergillus heteromorphus CBS 117.55]|uniref:MFS general substrate transporter n=1 Tax=Aspergillus heteromorphus CBS 117.55 TaxID=1448321 RepID=A0A317X5D0_9EURO|nr:MFS general substrate transporter [Aspergillus heteromorphus CBS 117.55]PWY92148.1 MFS general substrate transporter [Aspergillus heteromorphus CBS 117.55]
MVLGEEVKEVCAEVQASASIGEESKTRDDHLSGGNTEDPSSFPEGGWEAWSVVLGAWCAVFPTMGIMNLTGLLEEWLADHQLQGRTKASISWIFSLWYFLFYLGGIQIGPIFDTHGLKYTLIPGCIGMSLSMMALSVSNEYYQFVLGFSILGGLSASAVYTPSAVCITHWFLQRRGLATGIATTAGGVGGIIFTNVFGVLSPQIGFPWTIRILGFMFIGSLTISLLFLKARLPPSPFSRARIDIGALKEPVFTMTSASVVLAEVGLMIVVTYLPSYARSHGIRDSLSYQLMTIVSATSIVGRVIPGILADKWGRFNVMFVTCAACAILSFTLWLNSSNMAGILAFAALFGFWSGPAISLTPVCVAQISKTENYGTRFGATTAVLGLALLVSIPVAGEILKEQNRGGASETEYSGLIAFCGAAYAGACLFLFLAKGARVGWRPTKIF